MKVLTLTKLQSIKQESTLLALVLAMLGADIPTTKTASILVCACTGVNYAVTKSNRLHLLTSMRNIASRVRHGHTYEGTKHFVNALLVKVDFFVSVSPLTNIREQEAMERSNTNASL
jgi:hypothetical protein